MMELTSKCIKKAKTTDHPSQVMEMDEDRISKLPDDVLLHILSHVNAKVAIQTSILSKRWEKLWHSLPHLNFIYDEGFRRADYFEWERRSTRFTRFVTQFLKHRANISSIRKFQLESSAETDSTFIEKCLDYAINHGVVHIVLDIHCYPTPLRLPDGLFASNTLRVLELKQRSQILVVAKPFILPNLETLYLKNFSFNDNIYNSRKEPFSMCPKLEKLTLSFCEVSGLIISASKLRVLEIFHYHCDNKIQRISTPRLTSFRYRGSVPLVCSNMDSPCLEQVHFDVFLSLSSNRIKKTMPVDIVGMLQQLGNAKFVALSLATIEILEMDLHLLDRTPSPFPHIKCLELKNTRHFNYEPCVPPAVMNYLTGGSSPVVKCAKGIQV